MPIHDWTRVDAGTFHAFHSSWIAHLMGALNRGLLPSGYYALAEQVASRRQTDLLTLRSGVPSHSPTNGSLNGGVAVAEIAPRVRLHVRPDPQHRPRRLVCRRRHLVIRHITGHQVVAVIEIVSPSNKDRTAHVRELAEKVVQSLEAGVHVLLLDLLPPTRHDPHGLHGAVWSYFDTTPYQPTADNPLTLSSYVWHGEEPEAFIEPVALGQSLIDMPLFLASEHYVNVPLEATYLAAYGDMPEYWRQILERPPEAAADL